MLTKKSVTAFLDELASSSPAPGGGSVAALSGALGAALTTMVCNLTIGKKKYVEVEGDMKKIKAEAEKLRARFTELIDEDTQAFNKVMEAYALPKESDAQKTLRSAAVAAATKEATLIPLEVMKHCIDALALAQQVASSGNSNSASDAGVSALMLHAACEGAALNVKINLNGLSDSDFVGWKSDEVESLLRTSKMMMEETLEIVATKIKRS
ncbi:MAG TPA: methenyltetrahydrofolate cyclohydrolase [Bacteroidetes bacterium]|jgi:methenyltetrahydrofolate cyclohydrolase|nr:methenyltetrahydrofolate cyclohydrolase [Bacteroidota bacterium]